MKTFGVRLNDAMAAALAAEALRRGVGTPTTLARLLIIDGLSGATSRAVEAHLVELGASFSRLERELPEALALAVARVMTLAIEEPAPTSDSRDSSHGSSLAAWVKSS